MKKVWRYAALGLLITLLISMGAFTFWSLNALGPAPEALNSLVSTSAVNFEKVNNWLVFSPAEKPADTGLILYPGGRVDHRSYAPLAQAIAAAGFKVIIVPMPLNFAFLGINRAAKVMTQFPEINTWAVGGHSLGGAMAAQFASSHTDQIRGLVLWAAYPPESEDLSTTNLAAISIYASNDGLATLEEINNSKHNLPDNTRFVEIQGGNHAGFGWYGPQSGDGQAEISREMQQALIVDATAAFLDNLSISLVWEGR